MPPVAKKQKRNATDPEGVAPAADAERDATKTALAAAAALERLEESRDPEWNPDDSDEGSSDDDDSSNDNDCRLKGQGSTSTSSTSNSRPLLLWQLDPQESFSDWTIYISTLATTQEQQNEHHSTETTRKMPLSPQQDDVYHVHRNMLTSGLFRSDYFRMLFQSQAFAEAQTSCSRIALVEPARKAFPLFLNLLYHPTTKHNLLDVERILQYEEDDDDDEEDDLTVSYDIANKPSLYRNHLVSLLHLADFFQATTLHHVIMKVIQKTPLRDFTRLYQQATTFYYSPLVQCVLDFMQDYCAKNVVSDNSYNYLMDDAEEFFKHVNVEFLINVVSSECHLLPAARSTAAAAAAAAAAGDDDDTYGRNGRRNNRRAMNRGGGGGGDTHVVVAGLVTPDEVSIRLSELVANYCMYHYNKSKQQQDEQSSIMATMHVNDDDQDDDDDKDIVDDDDDSNDNKNNNIDSQVNVETFRILTQKDYLPCIAFNAAKKLLQLEKLLLQQQVYDDQNTVASSSSRNESHNKNNGHNNDHDDDDDDDANLTCLQKRCLDAFLRSRYCIDIKNLSDDDTIRMLRNNSTLLSTPAIVNFMSKLLQKHVVYEQGKTRYEQGKTASLQCELQRFQLLPAREVIPARGNDSNDDDDDDINRMISSACGGRHSIKPVYSCAPQKYLPEHLKFGQDHDISGGGYGYGQWGRHRRTCPGHVLTKDRKRILFTYNAQETQDDDDDDDEEEEEELIDSSEEDSENDDNGVDGDDDEHGENASNDEEEEEEVEFDDSE